MSNALATFVGAIIGIPVALWINRIQQKILESNEEKKLHLKATERKLKIVKLLGKELKENLKILTEFRELAGKHPSISYPGDLADFSQEFLNRKVFLHRLRIELWNAFSDGGELQWIQDLDLLQSLTTAYHSIRMTIHTSSRFQSLLESSVKEGVKADPFEPNDRDFLDTVLIQLKEEIEIAIRHTESALKTIEAK